MRYLKDFAFGRRVCQGERSRRAATIIEPLPVGSGWADFGVALFTELMRRQSKSVPREARIAVARPRRRIAHAIFKRALCCSCNPLARRAARRRLLASRCLKDTVLTGDIVLPAARLRATRALRPLEGGLRTGGKALRCLRDLVFWRRVVHRILRFDVALFRQPARYSERLGDAFWLCVICENEVDAPPQASSRRL